MKKTRVFITLIFVGLIGISGMAHADLNNGLVAHYPFNGNSNDESANGNHGTVYGATLTEDRFGVTNSAYEFDGDDYIEVLDAPLLNITEKITISVWVKASTPSEAYARMVSKCQSGVGNRQYNLALDETGSLARTVVDTETSPTIDIIGQNIIDNNWHNIVMTFDSDKAIKLYVDTNLQDIVTVNSGLVSRSSNLVFGGIAHTPQDQSFRGTIDDIRIYNRALCEEEIFELYGQPTSNAGPDQIICNEICNEVILDGRKSYDVDGEIVSFEWELRHKENPSLDKTASGETPTISNLGPGKYDVILTVTDGAGLINTDKMILTVQATCNPCSILKGDFDSDGDVDGDDLKIFSQNFGTYPLIP